MIYTSYEMIRDCRAGKPEGWSYFIVQYVPVIRKVLAHYFPRAETSVEQQLPTLRAMLLSLDPVAERPFVARLRQDVLAMAAPAEEGDIELDVLGEALDTLTVVEKEAVWFESMRYNAEAAGRMLRMAPATVEKVRGRAGELFRGKLDRWRSTILTDNGLPLGRAAAARATEACIPPKALLDMIDGRTTWPAREAIERHANACWHCIDHFCRLHETIDLLRASKPLTASEAEPFKKMMGLEMPPPKFWQRLRGV
jgi:hypothetical protein